MLKEQVAKWLFKNRHRLPNQRFYANWYDEIGASPLTEKEYFNLANEILNLFKAEVNKLTVIEIDPHNYGNNNPADVKLGAEAQLQADKKQLLESMEE